MEGIQTAAEAAQREPGWERENGRMTISDVAEALHISKTTVSRAISGKGRIGEETRERVLAYIKEHNYKQNPLAKGLAQSRTYNIGWVMPGDSDATDLPFFQRSMIGIEEAVAHREYDVLLIVVYEDNKSQLKRVVEEHKVDGLVLGRTLLQDASIAYLKNLDIPFVTIGSTEEQGVVQIDNDHIAACRELTAILIMKGMKRLSLIGGNAGYVVNLTRKEGFEAGVTGAGLRMEDMKVYMNCCRREDVENAIDNCLRNDTDCIVCMDDVICNWALDKLRREGVSVPEQMKVASFYNSALLDNNRPAITSLQYDPRELGKTAGETLLRMIEGEPIRGRKLLGYEVTLKESTQ